jgi:hypothetical protein
MATVAGINQSTGTTVAFIREWDGIGNGDDGAPIACAQYTDKSVQVFGVFGVGGSLAVEGSNDGINWSVLTDPQGNNLAITAAKIEMVSEATMYVRPRVTAGDGTTNLTCLILMKE